MQMVMGGGVAMRANRRFLAVVIVLVAAALAASGCDSLVNRLNLLGQTRYTVGDQVYGIEEVAWTASRLEISLVRAVPVGQIDESDAEALAAVEGIVVVDGTGDRVGVSEVETRPDEHEQGFVTLVFDVTGHDEPFTLEWPAHDPYAVSN
jgi:hypothetical protein